MSSYDSSSVPDSDHSSSKEIPPFRMLTEKEKAAGSRKPKKSQSTWYCNLNAKRRKKENEKLRNEFANLAKEFEEIEQFQLVTEPLHETWHRVRGSSLSPNTPPPRPREASVSLPHGSVLSTSLKTVSLSDSTLSISSKASESKRVTFRLKDSPAVSNGEKPVSPIRRPLSGRARDSDDDQGPPNEADDSYSLSSDSSSSERKNEWWRPSVAHGKPRTLSSKNRSSSAESSSTSTSLTKAEVIRKRRERIERQRLLGEEIRVSRLRSSSEESTGSENVWAKPASSQRHSCRFRRRSRQDEPPADNKGVTNERSSRRRLWSAHSLDVSPLSTRVHDDDEDPFTSSRQLQSLPRGGASRHSSSTPIFPLIGESRLKGKSSVHPSHSTPLEGKMLSTDKGVKRFFSFDLFPVSTQRRSSGHSSRILGRGEDAVQTRLSAHDTVEAGGVVRSSVTAAPEPSFGYPHTALHMSSGIADRSVVIRFGLGNYRERVLVSNTTSASSAIASLCTQGGSAGQPSAWEAEGNQNETPHRFSEGGHVDALSQLLKLCGQSSPVTFEEALRLSEKGLSSRKLGEGCSAEVYSIRRADAGDSAVKVVPIGGEWRAGVEKPLSVSAAIPEVVIASELSNLRFNPTNQTSNFIALKCVHCVQGPYPAVLVRSWEKYDAQLCSENENPATFDAAQKYVVFEFEHGGKTLERFKGSPEMLHSAFLQVSFSLAVAESELEFEHRDLHGENVLLRRTSEKEVRFLLHGREVRLPTAGVRASIIDYTLSRMRKGDNVIFTDVAYDEELFQGSGSYQYQIYRIMKENNGNNWEAYEPATNIVWLHYLLVKILSKCTRRSKSDTDESESDARNALAALAETILDFESVSAFVAGNFPPPSSPPSVSPPPPSPPPATSHPPPPQSSPEKPSGREKRRRLVPEKATSHPMRLRSRRK